ncbi:heterokaryon incompatibility protein-domain-containing protein [Bisporella sp. PMI_857]|nr:heterokaryon incompatibility protein-domain-containing protein [Bisporella sp. PMI_857]
MPATSYSVLRPAEIRLVELHSENAGIDITCSLIQVSLDRTPRYEAVSYTWGSNENSKLISCSGTPITVTQNCYSMLRRLRQPAQPRLLWIDAICIDQLNIPERNSQVAIMGNIYRRASQVVIDIGEESKDSEHALDSILTCSPSKLYPMLEGLDIRDSVNALYSRPWFNRIWVLQEVFMARKAIVLCGKRVLPWSEFCPKHILISSWEAGETENWHPRLPFTLPNSLLIESRETRSYSAAKDFFKLLRSMRTCDATDPRDKVFALLPLLEDSAQTGLAADYSKGKEEVFIETARWLVENAGISLLSCCTGDSEVLNMPSWVPDWSVKTREPWMIALSSLFYPLRASKDFRPVAEVIAGAPNAELKVRGILVDRIRTTSGMLDIRTQYEPPSFNDDGEAVQEFVSDFELYRMELGDDAVELPRAKPWKLTTREKRLHPPRWLIKYGMPFQKPILDNDSAGFVTHFCGPRQLVTTEKGYLGVTSRNAQPGDLVCCLLGADVPFILRQAESGTCGEVAKHYTLVREAYVYGLMEGEALFGIDAHGADGKTPVPPLQDFHII